MARPRVIIADTDLNYVAPLQLKFAKEFFEQIDVEFLVKNTFELHNFINMENCKNI